MVKEVISEAQCIQAIQKMAIFVYDTWERNGRAPITLLPLMNGARRVSTELELCLSPEVVYNVVPMTVHCRKGSVQVEFDKSSVERNSIIVDDIFDSGKTMLLAKSMLNLVTHSCGLTLLARTKLHAKANIVHSILDLSTTELHDKYVVGRGMVNDRGYHGHLPYIGYETEIAS